MKTPESAPTNTLGTPLGYLEEHKWVILQYALHVFVEKGYKTWFRGWLQINNHNSDATEVFSRLTWKQKLSSHRSRFVGLLFLLVRVNTKSHTMCRSLLCRLPHKSCAFFSRGTRPMMRTAYNNFHDFLRQIATLMCAITQSLHYKHRLFFPCRKFLKHQ